MIGSAKDLFSEEFQRGSYYDPIFIFLYKYDKINSHYPDKMLISAMNNYFDYLYRKRLGLKFHAIKNKKEIRKYFYELCDEIDRLDEEKS